MREVQSWRCLEGYIDVHFQILVGQSVMTAWRIIKFISCKEVLLPVFLPQRTPLSSNLSNQGQLQLTALYCWISLGLSQSWLVCYSRSRLPRFYAYISQMWIEKGKVCTLRLMVHHKIFNLFYNIEPWGNLLAELIDKFLRPMGPKNGSCTFYVGAYSVVITVCLFSK